VGELVDDYRVAVGWAGEEVLGVDRAGLGLQGEQEVIVVVDDAAGGERVAAEPPLQEVQDLALAGEGAWAIPLKVAEAGSTRSANRSGSRASYIHSPSRVR
jgi:hypothetical protein